jgi:hypothetical protein
MLLRMDEETKIQVLQGQGIINALEGHRNQRVEPLEDPNTGQTVKIWITFSDPAVLELEATVDADGNPALVARMHYRTNDAAPL